MWENIFGQFDQSVVAFGPKIPSLIFSFLVGYLVIRLLSDFVRQTLTIAKVPKTLSDILISLLAVILWFILVSELTRQIGLSSLSAKISGSLILLGFAIANGVSALAGDITSGAFLAKDKDFECGTRIKAGEVEGEIEKIDMRKTRIRDKDGNLHIIPNSKVDNLGWQVFKQNK